MPVICARSLLGWASCEWSIFEWSGGGGSADGGAAGGMVMPGMGSCWAAAGAASDASTDALANRIRDFTNFSKKGGDAVVAPPPLVCRQLAAAMLRMLRGMALMLGSHVLAAVLAAIHSLVIGRLALLIHMLGMLSRGLRCRRNSRLGSGRDGRNHQCHHDQVSRFRNCGSKDQERFGGGVAVSG